MEQGETLNYTKDNNNITWYDPKHCQPPALRLRIHALYTKHSARYPIKADTPRANTENSPDVFSTDVPQGIWAPDVNLTTRS